MCWRQPGKARAASGARWTRLEISELWQSRLLPLGREQLGLVLGHERVDDLAERLALDDCRQLVERQIDAVVADAALREIVGADALGAVAGADLAAPLGGAGGVALLPLGVVEPAAQH